ncbi:heme peroxidase [Mycena vitilis]|nr:heme peroxidase [Mycena vitilis]
MLASLALFGSLATANAYVWPSPQLEALDSVRFGLISFSQPGQDNFLSNFADTCSGFLFANISDPDAITGRTNAADWLRTAYHDMATHNVDDGTGGLDASIRFLAETNRTENPGTGFNNTVQEVFAPNANRYVSIADSIALGAVMVMEACDSGQLIPQIAYRGGRVDALAPNSPGVPRPEQSLDEHIDSFKKQGFTKEEMISLVACGHTFGGVQHEPFPDIVPDLQDPQNNSLSVSHFDTTDFVFDNKVATEYISDTTGNPLVVGLNETTNSDKRIFASDGNVTMKSFAGDPKLFGKTCSELIARMIDTVPKGVQLTEVIEPLPVKPTVSLTLGGDTLQLTTEVRFFGMSNDTLRNVQLLADGRDGKTANWTLDPLGVTSSFNNRYSAMWYTINATTSATAGFKNISFLVDGKLESQGGLGFPLQDGVVFANSSCTFANASSGGRMDVGVRNGLNPSRVYLEEHTTDNTTAPIIVEYDIQRPANESTGSAYTLWSFEIPAKVAQYSIGAEVDGVKRTTPEVHFSNKLPLCAGNS